MKCPYCDYETQESRCPKCRETLTTWVNYHNWGRQSYEAGLDHLRQGATAPAAELLLRAVVFGPDTVEYLDAYGRVLGQLGRYREAAEVLSRALELKRCPATQAAYDKARELAEQPVAPPEAIPASRAP